MEKGVCGDWREFIGRPALLVSDKTWEAKCCGFSYAQMGGDETGGCKRMTFSDAPMWVSA